jgi:hypothetical protein
MGNFLVIAADRLSGESGRLFLYGLDAACYLKHQVPNARVEREGVYAASFPRYNGSGSAIISDTETSSWLLAIGTWVHAENYGPGAELRLLSRYLKVGPVQLALELEGFFVVVVRDARTQEIVVLTDIVGSCHCYVRKWKNVVALSSSALLLASLDEFHLDPVAAQEFLCTGVMYEDRTFYQEVRKLDPASVYRFVDGALKTKQRYWRITDITPESLDGQQAVQRLGETLTSAAWKVGHLFKQPVCDLTGGYDSRTLVAAFLTAGVQFATTVSGPAESPDVQVSYGLAQALGLPHLHLDPPLPVSFAQVKRVFSLTDGEYDLIEYARIFDVHQTLSERFDISLNGSFGEVARGYWWELLFPRAGGCWPLDTQKLAKLRYAAQNFDASLFPPDTRLNLVTHFAEVIEGTNTELAGLPNTLQMDHAYLMMRMQRWQGRIASSTNQLWPCLSPFMFRSVLETMLQTTARLRRRSLLIRQMLTELQPSLAEFPLEHGYPPLPATWKNLYQFWPVPVYLGKRVLSKVRRLYGKSWRPSGFPSSNLPIRSQLWLEEEICGLLQPAKMKLNSLLNPVRLTDFLADSQQPAFLFGDQWARLLSLEYTLRILGQIRTSPVNP